MEKLYTPNDVAKKYGIDPKKVRIVLRANKIQKNDDGKYGFNQIQYMNVCRLVKTELMRLEADITTTENKNAVNE